MTTTSPVAAAAEYDAVTIGQAGPASLRARRKRRRLRLWFVHHSGRFDRSTSRWRASLRRLRRKGSVITGTEAAGRSARDFKAALEEFDWDYAHLSGAAVGECYATWDGEVLELAGRPFARKLTNKTWVRSPEYGGGKAAFVHALVVPLRTRVGLRRRRRTWVLVIVHMPLDNTEQRAEVWVDCCNGLVDLEHDIRAEYPDDEPVIVADFNKNLREDDEAHQVERHLERPLGMKASWRGRLPQAGTHVRQLIDFALARAGVIADCQLLEDDDSSDHRPFRYRIRSAIARAVRRNVSKIRRTPPEENP